MTWKWCEDPPPGYWASGEEPPSLCQTPPPPEEKEVRPHEWTRLHEVDLLAGETYYVKCRPGASCEAEVNTSEDLPHPSWKMVQKVEIPCGRLVAGKYRIFCRTGGPHGGGCQVALRAM